MEGTPPGVDLGDVAEALGGVEGVEDVHHIHAWALTSGRHVFSAHLRIAPAVDQAAMLTRAHTLLRDRYGFFFVTLQLETTCLDEDTAAEIDVTRLPGSRSGKGHQDDHGDGAGLHRVPEAE